MKLSFWPCLPAVGFALVLAACSDGTGPVHDPGIAMVPASPLLPTVVGSHLPEPIGVLVTDTRGRPLNGVAVDWSVARGGGTIDDTDAH